MTSQPPRVRIERRRDATGDLLPGWWVRWRAGGRCEHTTHADALGCVELALRS